MIRQRFRRSLNHLRLAAPDSVRRAYRICSAIWRGGRNGPQRASFAKGLVEACRVHASRTDMISALPKQGVVCEVGTLRGDFARQIVKAAQPRELHIIDIDFSLFDPTGLPEETVTRHDAFSVAALAEFPDATFDWIYIDGDHAYQSVRADAEAAAPKLKPGGFLVFNDFAHIDPYFGQYGVHRAVVEFANAWQWPVAHLAFEPNCLYDIALQKPSN